jgi:hypothetical protein
LSAASSEKGIYAFTHNDSRAYNKRGISTEFILLAECGVPFNEKLNKG